MDIVVVSKLKYRYRLSTSVNCPRTLGVKLMLCVIVSLCPVTGKWQTMIILVWIRI